MKFKLWSKNEKVMITIGGYFVETDGSVWMNSPSHNHGDCLIEITDSVEVLRYTGLKDKNGKEIYEGDIIKMNVFWAGYYNEDYGDDADSVNKDYIGEVVLLASKGTCLKKPYWVDNEEDGVSGRLDWYKPVSGCNSEIIGNKFKNPELMEEK